jgi:hypothetical protein
MNQHNYVTQTKAGTEAIQKGAGEKATEADDDDLLALGIEGKNALSQRVAWLEKEMRVP